VTGYFGQHAARVLRAGYDPIPISRHDDSYGKDRGKQPAQLKGWSKGCPSDEWGQYADCGLGILTRHTPAVDVDVLDPELADAIQAQIDRVLGDAPIRIGLAPKRLMPFQLRGMPFKKLRLEWRGVGDQEHDPDHPPRGRVVVQWPAVSPHKTCPGFWSP
jgi:hypothetical protein